MTIDICDYLNIETISIPYLIFLLLCASCNYSEVSLVVTVNSIAFRYNSNLKIPKNKPYLCNNCDKGA